MWQQLLGFPKGWIEEQEGMKELWISVAVIVVMLTVAVLSVRKLVQFVECTKNHLLTVPISLMITGTSGLAIGLLLGLLSSFIMLWLGNIGEIIRAILMTILGYIGLRIGITKSEDILSFWKSESLAEKVPSAKYKMIDSNIAIDGRIIELCQDGFIEGGLLVPDFILHELQLLADSSDTLRRHRGKRGLEVITHLQQLDQIEVIIQNTNYEESEPTDNKLLRLALDQSATLITNDSNLQQLCQLQHIHVLNLNNLASIMKPILRAGQIVKTAIIKSGKEAGQGIAYLDDGTMIVVEDSQSYIGRECEVIVTSVLQTANGKMVFAKLHRSE